MITERAMLAAVHISIWTAVKHDRKVSRDVADQHGAHQSAGRYNKQLLRGADKLDELRTLAGQIRQHFYKITLPWSDEGFRLLPSNFYFGLMERIREFEASFEQGVESFLEVYPQYIDQVRPELNGLFREEDYPSAEKLRAKFGVKLEILPIPSGADFRVQMSAEEQARVSREIDANVRQSLARGTEDLWKRLREVVSHMVDRLNEPESRFHASLVTNVFDLVEILPRLNVHGDENLNRFAEQVKQRLCTYSAQDLKKHDLLRVSVLDEWNSNVQRSMRSDDAQHAAFVTASRIYMQDAPIDVDGYYRADGAFGADGHTPSKTGLALEALGRMAQTPERLATTGGDDKGQTIEAARSTNGKIIQILISNYEIPADQRAPRTGPDELTLPSLFTFKLLPRRAISYTNDHGYDLSVDGLKPGRHYSVERYRITDSQNFELVDRTSASETRLHLTASLPAPSVEFIVMREEEKK